MNKLAGKELQSLPSQIDAGYSEGAAATDPLSPLANTLLSLHRAMWKVSVKEGASRDLGSGG